MLAALASAVFLGSESLGTHDHIILSQNWDFPFWRLLRLGGSRWRHSTPPPQGFSLSQLQILLLYPQHGPHRKVFHSCITIQLPSNELWRCIPYCFMYSVLPECLWGRCLAMMIFLYCYRICHNIIWTFQSPYQVTFVALKLETLRLCETSRVHRLEVSNSQSSDYQDDCLLRCRAV
jgi:hypothetical protein